MIKEYHVSENLLDFTALATASAGSIPDITYTFEHLLILTVEPNTTYTLSSTGTGSISGDALLNRSLYFGGTDFNYVVFAEHPVQYTTSDDGKLYIGFVSSRPNAAQYLNGTAVIMLNEGTTALPYEPYGNTWNTKSYCKATTGSETYSNFPIVVRSREQSISSWNMKGNEQHTGTASPTSPIEINGTGDRTKNLFDVTSSAVTTTSCTMAVNNDVLTQVNTGGNSRTAWKIDDLQVGTDYTLSVNFSNPNGSECQLRIYDSGNNSAITTSSPSRATTGNLSLTFTAATSTHYIRIYSNTSGTANSSTVDFTDIMLNEGSTALPYEPYGYKIPISANGTALTPVYLTEQLMKINDYADSLASSGTVTYQIKKLVLTGNETGWTIESGTTYVLSIADQLPTSYENAICSHYVLADSYNNLLNTNNTFAVSRRPAFFIHDNTLTTVDALKTYLATQYANGTPVTVYYVIETAVTEQVTVPTIPTTSSPTTIDVNTSVKPSEMSLTYDGYKICKEQKYQNNAWT